MENQTKLIKISSKRLFSLLSLLIVLLSVNLPQVAAESPPIFPSSFWGTVKIDGENVVAGTIITAKMEGEVVASTEVIVEEGQSVYFISIPGDESMEGDRVDFFIGGELAEQYGFWHSGTNPSLNLSIFTGEYFNIFIPLVVR